MSQRHPGTQNARCQLRGPTPVPGAHGYARTEREGEGGGERVTAGLEWKDGGRDSSHIVQRPKLIPVSSCQTYRFTFRTVGHGGEVRVAFVQPSLFL